MRIFRRAYPTGIATADNISIAKAKKLVAEQTSRLLPKGQNTPYNYFYSIFEKENKIGYLWMSKREKSVLYISDIYIYSRYRSKGFGTKVVSWIQRKAEKSGIPYVRLHAFGHNLRAIKFYERCGFTISNVYMKIKT